MNITKVSNRVKRNISFALFVVGLFCMAARSVNVLQNLDSIKAWFEFAGIAFLTWRICYDKFLIYRRRVKKESCLAQYRYSDL